MIRDYHATDIEAVIALWRRSSDLAHPFLSKVFQDRVQGMLRDLFAAELAEVTVVEADGAVAGFIAMIGNEIGGLFVDPGHLGRGHGHALVAAAVASRRTVTVEVFERNAIGRRFYDRFGFSTVSAKPHDETGETLLLMAWSA